MGIPIHVLILSQSEQDTELIIKELYRAGYETVFERMDNYEKLADSIIPKKWDVIIADYVMPNFKIFDALKLIKTRKIDIPFIIISDIPGEYTAVAAIKAGASDYIMRNNPVRLISAINRELNDKAEREKTKYAEEELIKTNGILYSVIEATKDPISIKDIEGKYIILNLSMASMLGKPVKDIIGKTDKEFFSADKAKEIEEKEYRILQTGMPQTYEENVKINFQTKTYITTKSVYYDNWKNKIGIFSISQDITEIKGLQEQLRQSQKLETLGQLAGGLAHDLNNLIIVIHGYSDLALMTVHNDSQISGHINEIQKASSQISNLTKQLLLFASQKAMDMKPFDINNIINDLLKILERIISEDISIKTGLGKQVWTLVGDIKAIEHVIMNMVMNAREAMPEGGTITINTEYIYIDEKYVKTHKDAKTGNFVCLSVNDTGMGINNEIIDRIFEPFFTTKKGRSGLGLSVLYGIVKKHEGWISVQNIENSGCSFKIYFPSVFSDIKEKTTISIDGIQNLKGNGERILVVEDQDSVREFAKKVFSENGYKVFLAGNTQEAVKIFEEQKGEFDLIFIDIVLPDGKGYKLTERLLKLKPEINVIFTTGHIDSEKEHIMCEYENYPLLEKPYSIFGLLKAVKESIKK